MKRFIKEWEMIYDMDEGKWIRLDVDAKNRLIGFMVQHQIDPSDYHFILVSPNTYTVNKDEDIVSGEAV